jgi:chemosensory pili system protein ChpA (sensor histidine kinase/response regulator)
MSEAIDYTAVNWVKPGLNEILNQARQSLEKYSEAPGDARYLQECMTSLHQARGPLHMADLRGADRLAGEMEAVIAALVAERITPAEETLEALMEAFIQLPDYLSRLGRGRCDAPVVLLPLINRLRALSGEEPLPESVVFTPDLTRPVPPACFNSQLLSELPDVQELAHTYRQRFQAGLVEWYRGGSNDSGLLKLREVLANLQQASRNESVARLWWFSAGLAEVLIRGAMPASTEIKQLFGRIDRQLKRLIDLGERAFSETIPEDLLNQLLSHILQSDIPSGRAGDIREMYAPSESDLRAASESMSGCNEALFSSVSAGACERIERIKERLDDFMRASPDEAMDLKATADDLHALGNIVGMIGLEEAGNTLAEQERHVRSMLDDGQSLQESGLMSVANALLEVEAVLREISAGNALPGQSQTTRELVCRQGLETVIREVIADMAGAREHIDNYIRMPGARDVLADVPQQLDQVRGGLLLAGEERAAVLVTQACAYVTRELIAGEQVPGEQQLDTLADAICSIEYYVEELKEGAVYGGMVLDVAEQSLEKLGYSTLSAGMQAHTEPAAVNAVPPASAHAATEAPEITALQVIAEDTDSEILDIFIEEAAEEISLLDDLLPKIINGTADAGTLETVRRAFHTLKGSGRMVGAFALGEFACVFEHLLKQLIDGVDGAAGSGEWHHELLAHVTGSLSQLLEQVKGGPAPRTDVNGLVMQAVNLMVSGAPAITVPADDAHAVINSTQPSCDVDDTQAVPVEHEGISDSAGLVNDMPGSELPVLAEGADPEIVEIFMEEAAEQLEAISTSLPEWLDNSGNREALVTACRAFHTLKGSGRMAGALAVGGFAWAIEALLHRVIDGSIEVNAELMEFLGKVSAPLSQLLDQVGGGSEPAADYRAVMEAAQRLERGESITPSVSGIATDVAESRGDETNTPVTDVVEVEPELMDIFGRECRDHLDAMQDFIRDCEHSEPACHVTEPLYRALHTLSGIAESAHVSFIRDLAGELYTYFGALDEARQPLGRDAVNVLKACTAAMSGLADRLPDTSFDPALLQSLHESIHALPDVSLPEGLSVADCRPADDTEETPVEAAYETSFGPGPASTEPEMESVPDTTETAVVTPADGVDHYADIDPELFEIFLEEAGEIIESSETTLHAWVADPGHRELMNEFQRQLHTLKGGARMVDISAIGNLSHSLETLLTRVVDGQIEPSGQLFDLLRRAHDRLADMLEKVRAREVPESAQALDEELSRLGSGDEICGIDALAGVETDELEAAVVHPQVDAAPDIQELRPSVASTNEPEAAVVHPQVDAVPDVHELPAPVVGTDESEAATLFDTVEAVVTGNIPTKAPEPGLVMPHQPERRGQSRVRGEQVRVQAELLDNLVGYSGEINIYRARLEQQVGVYRFNLTELLQTINRVRDQLRQFEIETETQILHRIERETEDQNLDFDPLEMDRYSNLQQLSRSLVETISDLHSIQELLDNTTRETESLLLQQSRVSTDLQEGLMRARMIPFAGLAPRLRRIVRQAAGELGKTVELTLDGAEGEMDRNVIERIIAPLEHMLRNAVDHGIERPEERLEAGKPETGAIRIVFRREGPEIVLQVADDGRGINHDVIRERAIERGLIAEDAPLSDSEVMQFVLQTGFSTADRVTQISGRGVGMDVVNSEVKQLGGSLLIDTIHGQGSIFTIRLPYTLASNQALLVRAGEDTFCIPLGTIEGVVRVDAAYLAECYQSPEAGYRYAGKLYQLHHLGALLKRGSMDLEGAQGRIPVLLVRIGEKRLALQVEALIGNREIVIKPLGAQLSGVHGVSGATILGDGRVILILDMAAVGRMAIKPQTPNGEADSDAKERLLIMVVDDSITVRKVTTRLLERYGFDVVTAKDGVDAMSLLQDRIPDVMLLDIEMPRMDGFELARHIRNDERLRHIPITMITSRTGDKHRERAMQLGVNHYLGKPFQEHELLKTIHRLIGIPMEEELERSDVYGQH